MEISKDFIFYDSNFTGVIHCVFMVNTILKTDYVFAVVIERNLN